MIISIVGDLFKTCLKKPKENLILCRYCQFFSVVGHKIQAWLEPRPSTQTAHFSWLLNWLSCPIMLAKIKMNVPFLFSCCQPFCNPPPLQTLYRYRYRASRPFRELRLRISSAVYSIRNSSIATTLNSLFRVTIVSSKQVLDVEQSNVPHLTSQQTPYTKVDDGAWPELSSPFSFALVVAYCLPLLSQPLPPLSLYIYSVGNQTFLTFCKGWKTKNLCLLIRLHSILYLNEKTKNVLLGA